MCKALGEPTRLAIFECLAACDACEVTADGSVCKPGASVTDVCCWVAGGPEMLSKISFHIDKLRQAGLVKTEKDGKNVVCSVDREALQDLISLLQAVADPVQ